MTLQTMERMQSEYVHLLASLFNFMRKSGIQDAEVKHMCTQALRHPNHGREAIAVKSATLTVAALTLDAWHRNRRYLDRHAEPRAIPLLGRSPSVEALIRAEKRRADAPALARRLRSLGLLIRSGRNQYRPAGRVATVASLDPAIQQYIARAYATLLATIRHNVSLERDSSRLIERFAEVPDLPRHRSAEFREFAQIQGSEFLQTLNDWLESRRAKRLSIRSKRTVRAGVHLYAYVGPAGEKTEKRRRGL